MTHLRALVVDAPTLTYRQRNALSWALGGHTLIMAYNGRYGANGEVWFRPATIRRLELLALLVAVTPGSASEYVASPTARATFERDDTLAPRSRGVLVVDQDATPVAP